MADFQYGDIIVRNAPDLVAAKRRVADAFLRQQHTTELDYDPSEQEIVDLLTRIEAEQWQQALLDIKSGQFRELPVWASVDQARQLLSLAIDHYAESVRAKYLSPGEGKAMAYLYQQQLARTIRARQAAGETPLAAEYPLVEARRQTLCLKYDTEATLEHVLQEWETLETQWHQIEAMIDAVVWPAKLALEAAETPEAAQAVFNNIQWPPI